MERRISQSSDLELSCARLYCRPSHLYIVQVSRPAGAIVVYMYI